MRSVIAALIVGLLVLPSAADSATAEAGEPADSPLWPMPIPERVGDIPTAPLDFYRYIPENAPLAFAARRSQETRN